VYTYNSAFQMSNVQLNISENSALALQALLHTADYKDAARYCSNYSEELLHVLMGDVVVALGDALGDG